MRGIQTSVKSLGKRRGNVGACSVQFAAMLLFCGGLIPGWLGGQVGYGDVVALSPWGRMAVLAMISVGVVLIPVQTSQLYSQLTARRSIQGRAPASPYVPS